MLKCKIRNVIIQNETNRSFYLYNVKKLILFFKRCIDIIVSLVGIILLIPLTIIIFICNLIFKENGPVFYTQERIGKNGKIFKMYKYRTMCTNSQEVLEKLLESDETKRKEWKSHKKLREDPRINKIGVFLRKTSIDEFPQFINILKGEMSLIGPRAVIDSEIEKFGLYKEKILSVKPGLTGYWAANGRSNTTYEERVKMEAYYVENFSLFLDFKILLKTVLSVMKREGAV